VDELSKPEFATRTHDHLNHYISAADTKASILLTAQLAFLGLTASAAANLVSKAGAVSYWLGVGAAGAGVLGVGVSISVIYPRTPQEETGFIFWENIVTYDDAGAFVDAFADLPSANTTEHIVIQNHHLASVADRKYRHLRVSLVLTGSMVGLATLAGVAYLW
jgi:hypothetical protein